MSHAKLGVEDATAQDEYIRAVENDGRKYCVKLPFKGNKPVLSSQRGPASTQMKYLLNKLKREPELKNYHRKVIESHHGVKRDSETTPLHVVFNTSSKPKGGVSLNDCPLKGPNLTERLNNRLMKFQTRNYTYTSNISRAFLRVGLKDAIVGAIKGAIKRCQRGCHEKVP